MKIICEVRSEKFVTADISVLSLERNSVLSELTFQHFEYDFQAMTLKSQKNPAKINGYSAVLQFVLPIHS